MSKITCTETLGTCPKCGSITDVQIELTGESITYHGTCDECGKFERTSPRSSFADLGEKISSTVGFEHMKQSA